MYERLTFSPEGSSEDKHLKAWIDNMSQEGAERSFPSVTTAANAIEAMRVLTRSRAQHGTKITLSVVWDQFCAAFLTTSGSIYVAYLGFCQQHR